MRAFLLVTAAVGLNLAAGPSWADGIRDSVVKIEVTRRAPDMVRPWAKQSPQEASGSGVVLDGGRVLTNAHVVLYASRVLIQPYESAEKIPARVVGVAPGIDLALLELEEAAEQPLPSLPLADGLPDVRATVNVYGFPLGGDELSITEGIVSRIEFTSYYYDAMGLRIQVDAALNPGNSGGPAVVDGHVVGLVFSGIKEAENIGYLIPVEEIAAFLEDIEDGHYEGRPMLFDGFQTAENAALRSWLGLDRQTQGIVVRDPYRDDDAYPLKQWDVITHIGPHEIDNQGKVRVADNLKLMFQYYVPHLAEADGVECTVFRDGETRQIRVPTDREMDRVIPILKGAYPEYFIYGPIVFAEATNELLRGARGRSLMALARSGGPLVSRMEDPPSFPGERIVIIANRMFPHRTTKGYDSVAFGVVEEINKEPVKNLRHLIELLRDNDDEFVTFKLAGKYESLVFRRSEIEEATEEILTDEGIRYQVSAALRDAWDQE